MKIYEIGTGYTPIPATMGAATEIVVEELTRSLRKNGHDAEIIDIKATRRKETELPIREVAVPKKFSGTDVSLGLMHKLKRVVYSISLAYTLKNILKHSDEKVVLHFHNQYNMFFFLKIVPQKLRDKCFIAYTNHSYIWHGNWKEIESTVKKRYFQEIECMKRADMVYVLNDRTVSTLTTKLVIEKKKIKLIDNGVNTTVYCPLTCEEKKSVKENLDRHNKTYFIQVGSVCDRKNQLGALKLLLPFLKEDKTREFIYAGGIIDEDYQKEIVEFAKKEGIEKQVKYLGEIEPGKSLNEYYNSAVAMIFPSKSEGFSLVIIEAMAAGVPVVINENLRFKLADRCLKYSNKEDFEAVIKANILNSDKQRELSEQAREAVLLNYSWDKIAQDYYATWVR